MALREVLASFVVDVDTSKLQGAGKAIDGAVGKVREAINLFAGAALVNGVRNFVTQLVDVGDEIGATADKLQIGTDELQQWRLAAQLSDVDAEALNGSLLKFQKNMAEAANPTSAQAQAFKTLGVSVKDANGNMGSMTDLLLGVADGVSQITDPAERTAVLMDLFGKQGAALGPLLSQGSAGVKELLGELEKTGGGITEDAVRALGDVDNATIKYDASVLALKGKLAQIFAPTLEKIITKLGQFSTAISKSQGLAVRLKTVLGVLGAFGFAAGLKMLLPYAAMALAIGAVILVVDDLVTGLRGGESVTAALLDKIFGKGAGRSIFKSISEDLQGLGADLSQIDSLGGKVEETLSQIGEQLVIFLVDDIPAAIDLATENVKAGTGNWFEEIVAVVFAPTKWLARAIEVGKQIVEGMAQGIKTNLALITSAFDGVDDQVVGTLQDKFQIKSPSKLLREKIAPNIVEGAIPTRGMFSNAIANMLPSVALPQPSFSGSKGFAIHQQNSYDVSIVNGSEDNVRRGMSASNQQSLRAAYAYYREGA